MATAPVTVNANLNFNPASVRAAGNQVQSAFGNINLPSKAVNNFNNSLGRITGQASEFDKSINAATARVFAFGAAVSIINGVSTAFKALISSTIEVEKRLTEISSIIGVSVDQLGRFKTAIFDVAKNTGQTFDTVANGAAELARQGLSAEETVKRLNAALILTRVSGLDAEGSVSALTAAINGFTSAGLTAEQIINKLIAVDTAFAVSAKDLAEAFSRAGSTAEDAGVSFDQLLGLITAVQQTTARGGAVIGNAFKSIFARLGRGTVIEDLKALGVEIDQSQTGVQKLQALATALANISDPTKANAIKELAGGVYQINIVSAALKDLSSETSIYARASEIAGQASNEAFQKNAQLNQTLAAQINSLVQGLTELGSKIGELTLGPVIQNLLTGANKLLDILNKVFDPEEGNKLIQGFFKGVGAFIAGPGLILVSAAFFKLFQVVAKFAAQGVSDLFKIGSEQERIKNIEGGIVTLLQQDANLRATLLSSSATQAQKEQAVINAIKQQNTLLTQQQQLVNSIASAAARAGVGGFTATGGFSRKGGKGRFAAGYSGNVSPQEAAMEMAAANQHGYKAGKVKRERIFDGSGSSFMGILNSAETRKDFINGSGYKSTLITPPNGFAASGFVPNYAAKGIGLLQAGPSKFGNYKLLLKEGGNYKGQFGKPFGQGSGALTKQEANASLAKARLNKKQSDEKSKQEKKQQQSENAELGSVNNRIKIQASKYGYLVPQAGFSEVFNGTARTKDGLNFDISNLEIKGPKVPTAELKGFKSQRLNIEDKLKRDIAKASVSYSRPISKTLGSKDATREDIEKLLAAKGGRGGAYGAIQSAIGAAFEAAVVAGIGVDDAVKEGPFFDANSKSTGLDKIFGTQGKIKYDFKVSNSIGNIASFSKKIFNEVGGQNKKTSPSKKTAASGFIPNFAAVNDAISREMEAGVPRDKIYIDQDDSLKSTFNREGYLVANTDHEPKGGKQGIKRAKREGKNPKTYGQNFAARGFVPNFVFGAAGGSPAAGGGPQAAAAAAASVAALTSASNSAAPALNNVGKAGKTAVAPLDKTGKGMKRLVNGAFGFSVVLSSTLPYLQQFAGAVALDEEALKRENEARNKAVKSLEEEKAKGASANAESIKSIEAEIQKRDESIASIEQEALKFAESFASATGGITNVITSLSILVPAIKNGIAAFRAAQVASAAIVAGGGSGGAIAVLTKFGLPGVIAAAVTAGLLAGFYKWESTKQDKEERNAVKFQIDTAGLNLGRLSTDIAKIQLIIDALGEASKEGYETIKLAAEGMRSEFQRLNDEIGVSGASSKITQAEGLDKIISGGKDFITQQNLRKTRDPFEQQRIVKNRETERAGPEADRELQRSRAKVALDMKGAQEDLYTALEPYLNQGTATSDAANAANAAISAGEVPQGVFSKDSDKLSRPLLPGALRDAVPDEKPIVPVIEIDTPIDSTSILDLEAIGSAASLRTASLLNKDKGMSDLEALDSYSAAAMLSSEAMEIAKANEAARAAAQNAYDPTLIPNVSAAELRENEVSRLGGRTQQQERLERQKGGGAGILEKDKREANEFAESVKQELSKSSKESQTELLKAFRAFEAASEDLKNTTAGVGGPPLLNPGNIVSNQEANMKAFSESRDALKALIQQRAEASGGDVGAVTQAFDENSARFEEGVKAQTDAFIKDQISRKQIEQNSLQQQKEVLDQFIDNFNASFLQNAERGADLFAEAMASGSGTRIQENIAQLQGASLGTGMTGSSDVFAQRQEALIQMMSSLESSGFFQSVGTGEEQAKFRSQFAGEVLGGGEITALQGALGAQSGNLQRQLSAKNLDGTENLLGKQINSDPNARSAIASSTLAYKEILTKLREAAVVKGDTNLTADVDKRLATLSDPNATAQQKIAAGNIGLEGTKLDDTTQTEFQKQLISAGGAIQSVIDLLKGESVANATNELGIKIEENVKSLEILRDAFKTTAEDIDLTTMVESITKSSDGFTEIIENLKESATSFKQELDLLKEGINALTTKFGELNAPSTTMKTDLDNLAIAAQSASAALKSITPPAGDSGEEVVTDSGPKTAGPNG
jgi:TP901 family phage tail tape measure protein